MPETKPILDPKRELPAPHDMQLPMTHWQRLPRRTGLPAHQTRIWFIFLPLLLLYFFFTPLPYYQTKVACTPESIYCPNEGWYLGDSLYERINRMLFTPKINNQLAVRLKPTSALLPSPTASWKIYRDIDFTFDYPASWVIEDNNFLYNPATKIEQTIKVPFREYLYFRSPKTNAKSAREYIDTQQNLFLDPSSNVYQLRDQFRRNIYTINGIQAEEYYNPFGEGVFGWYLVFSNNNHIIEFGPSLHSYSEKVPENRILSTFKFFDPPTPQPVKDALLTITAQGGICPSGPCKSITIIERDGTLLKDNVKKGRLTEMELIHLNSLINSADYAAIRSKTFTGTCPTAYDGQELIYEFYKEAVVEKVASCETAIDESNILFKTVGQLLIKYR